MVKCLDNGKVVWADSKNEEIQSKLYETSLLDVEQLSHLTLTNKLVMSPLSPINKPRCRYDFF